jgi:multiple sugar transport system permease protein
MRIDSGVSAASQSDRGLAVVRWSIGKRQAGAAVRYALLVIVSALFLLPLYLIARGALMTQAQLTAPHWLWFPPNPDWRSFADLFARGSDGAPSAMLTGLCNSAIIATTTLVLQLLVSSMAGYALARIPARGKTVLFGMIVATLMVPSAVTFVPTFAIVAQLGGVNTQWGIIAPGVFSAFSIFLFRQFYLRFPTEVEEAGRLDGLGYFGIYWRLLLPNSKSILVALGILTFIGSWNSFLWPLVIGQDPGSWTVQIALSNYLTSETINLPELFAAAAVAVAPLVVIFLLLQRYIVEGAKFSSSKE